MGKSEIWRAFFGGGKASENHARITTGFPKNGGRPEPPKACVEHWKSPVVYQMFSWIWIRDVLRIRSHGKSQCFTTIWENICVLFLTICHGANQIWHPMPAVGICFSSKFKNLQLCNYMGVSLIGFVVYDSYRFVTSTTLTKFQDPRIIFPGCLTLNVRISICVFHIERYSTKQNTNQLLHRFLESWLPKVIAWDPSESWLDELQRHRAWRSRYQLEISTENFI